MCEEVFVSGVVYLVWKLDFFIFIVIGICVYKMMVWFVIVKLIEIWYVYIKIFFCLVF